MRASEVPLQLWLGRHCAEVVRLRQQLQADAGQPEPELLQSVAELRAQQPGAAALLSIRVLCVSCVERDGAEQHSRGLAEAAHLQGQARLGIRHRLQGGTDS